MNAKEQWLVGMLDSLKDGEYWHIPSDNSLLKINKQKRQLSVIIGELNSPTIAAISGVLPKLGYSLSFGSEEGLDYYCP